MKRFLSPNKKGLFSDKWRLFWIRGVYREMAPGDTEIKQNPKLMNCWILNFVEYPDEGNCLLCKGIPEMECLLSLGV